MFDQVIMTSRTLTEPVARLALFLCYFWFGLLKVLDLSPAGPLVTDLLRRTIPFMEPEMFLLLFGIFEMLIGILWVKRGWEKIALPLFIVHMATTFGPLFMLPAASWTGFMVPTLEGQYIIKNFALIASALAIVSRMKTGNEVR